MRPVKFRAWNGMNMFEVCDIDFLNKKVGEMFRASLRNEYDIVDEVALMQYTGLFDRNGTPIYEGDLLKIEGNWPTYAVVFDEKTAAFGLQSPTGPFYSFSKLHERKENMTEILGNRFEHPHLLEAST